MVELYQTVKICNFINGRIIPIGLHLHRYKKIKHFIFETQNHIVFVFFSKRRLSPSGIRQLLEDQEECAIPYESDVSGVSDDSDVDHDWVPVQQRDQSSSEDEDKEVRPTRTASPGYIQPQEPAEELPDPEDAPSTSAGPPKAKAKRTSAKIVERREWIWEHGNIEEL